MSKTMYLRCAALVLLAGSALAQSTWYVDAAAAGPGTGTSLDPFQSIQLAIDQPATVDGDTVLVLPGTYHELVDLRDKELVLKSSAGPGVTTIDTNGILSMEHSGVKIRGGQGPACRLEGFTVVGGAGTYLVDPIPGWDWLFAGGGLLVVESSPTIVNCVLRDNDGAQAGGGAFVLDAEPVFVGCKFLDNYTKYRGAGLRASNSKVTLIDAVVEGNHSNLSPGVDISGGSLAMQGGRLTSNLGGVGGNHLRLSSGVTAEIVGASFANGHCTEGNGGAVLIEGGDARFEDCSFDGNSAGDPVSNHAGGAIYAEGATIELRHCSATNNESARGGAIFLEDCAGTIEDSSFADNLIYSGLNWFWAEGGAVGASGSSLTVARTVFERNAAICISPSAYDTIARGGALWCDTQEVLVDSCEFVDNEAFYDASTPTAPKREAGAQGGALFGPALVKWSVFTGNRAHSNAQLPGIWVEGGAAWGARLASCSFTGNVVDGTGPVPDTGPAAEASIVVCYDATDNLPAHLEPFGLLCDVLKCGEMRSSGYTSAP